MPSAVPFPRYKEYDEVREIECLYLDSIAKARKYIYIENQYLSSYRIGEAIKERLVEKDGPGDCYGYAAENRRMAGTAYDGCIARQDITHS